MKILLTSTFSKVGETLFRLTNKKAQNLSVAFIPTASNCYKEKPWIATDRNKLVQMGFKIADIDLESESKETLVQKLEKVDVIFVAGGNTLYLLSKSIDSGFKDLVKELITKGKIYIGSSAGSILAGPSHEPFKEEELKELGADFKLKSYDGVGLVDYVIVPHFNQKKYLEESKATISKYKDRFKMRTLNDNEAIIIDGPKEDLVSINL